MPGGARDTQVSSSPAVAANAEGDEIEVLESIDVLPMAPEDVSSPMYDIFPQFHCCSFCPDAKRCDHNAGE